jgi:para-nitrobenzyl esterase
MDGHIASRGSVCARPRRAGRLTLFIIAALLMTACAASDQPAPTTVDGIVTVDTTAGSVRGKVSGDGAVDVFRGVPYAAPPVGELRWKPPRPPVPWQGSRDAFEAGSPCPQSGRLASTNEDCLYLNIWAPHRRPEQEMPVMVFIHGGGQRQSAAHEYNADWLVTRGTPVVYVSMNYRLNVFAFLAHKELTAEEPELGSGNYALLDQLQALRWVRDNIANFGGDPDNVTIFGESGGAQAVCILLTSPPAQGYFHRAISQSGPCQWQLYPSLAASEARGAQVAAELGCTGPKPLACLRALPTSAVSHQGAGCHLEHRRWPTSLGRRRFSPAHARGDGLGAFHEGSADAGRQPGRGALSARRAV